MNLNKLDKSFFERDVKLVARDLLGKVLVRKLDENFLKGKIIETEAYYGEKDPASWARFGKRKDNYLMWEEGGKILIKNVHKHIMLNFVTGKNGEASAVLIRRIEPLNFSGRCFGPGLLTNALGINKNLNGKFIGDDLWVEDDLDCVMNFKIKKGFRVGVKNDFKERLRFYIELNK